MQKLPVVFLGTGLIFLVGSVLLGWILIPGLIRHKIEEVSASETPERNRDMEQWENITTPIHMSFYMYNVTNPDEVQKGHNPILTEHGPYVYEEKRYKTDLSVDEETDTVTYRQPVTYYFRPDLSNGTEDDVVTIINLPLIGLSAKADTLPVPVRLALELYRLRFKETLFITRQIREILFEGYKENMIDEIQRTTGMKLLPNATFGMYYGKNGSDDGLYEIFTGITDSTKFGQIFKRNGETELTWWGKEGGGEYCNKINGSDGSIFPPFLTKDRILRLFNSDLCRSLYFTFDQEVDYRGVTAYRFTIPPAMLEDPTLNPDNLCFCPNPRQGCPKSGVLMLSGCRKGAPIVASTPHFLDGDARYAEQAGLIPNRSRHETFMELEPNTGVVLRAAKRIQVNVELKPFPIFAPLKKVPHMIFPVMWAEEYAAAGENTVAALKSKLLRPLSAIDTGKWVGLGLSGFFIALGILVFYLRCRRKRNYA